MSRVWTNTFLTFILAGLAAFAQSVQMVPAPGPLQAPQGAQRPGGPPVGRQPTPNTIAKTPTGLAGVQPAYQGTLDGYVFWDTSAVQHNPPGACDGLIVQVSAGSPPTGSTPAFEQFSPLGNVNKLTYLNNGSSFGVCAYTVKVPVGQDLRVQVMVSSSVFSQGVAAVTPPSANNLNAPIKIDSGKCNNLPPAVPSPSVLGSNWWTCGNFAYNVNFVLQPSGSGSPNFAGGKQGLFASPARGNLSSAPAGMLANTSVPAVQSPGLEVQGQGNNGRVSQSTQQPLTNTDILKMVKGGVPESVIVSSIQSATKHFNFGPDGCRALKQGRVSVNVLNAMGDGGVQPCTSQATGGAGGKAANDLNPQPGRKPVDPALQTKLGPAKTQSVVKNSLGTRGDAAMIAVLQKQRGAADVEAAQMKLSVRPASQAGLNRGTSQLMSATGGTGSAGISQSASPAAVNNVGSAAKISPAVTHLALNATVAICAGDPTFRILNVSGSAGAATFTPIDQYNLYTITGCSFGNAGSADKVYIYGTGSFRGNFAINFWSDNSIVVALDESISGYPDLSNINLVVQRNDGQQTEKQGFKFYATRQIVPLSTIPSGWANLATFTSGFKTMTPQYFSPATSAPHSPTPTGTAFVSRFYDGQKFDPTTQANTVDWYDFSHLAPGFTTDSFQVTTYPQSCPYVVTYKQDFGTWRWYWGNGNSANNIYILPADTTCSGFNADSMILGIPVNVYQNWTGSYYALQVWVNGPRGIDPVTNQPVSQR